MALGSNRSTRRRWSWLLSLGLLFAFAQAAANAHAISHFGKDGPRDGGLAHAQCELCLIGAAIGGAAPLPEPPTLRHPLLDDVAIDVAFAAVRDVAPALAYRSRAPPAAQR